MRYVQRDSVTGDVVGHYANPNPHTEDEPIPDDHPDIEKFRELQKFKPGPSMGERLAEIERRLAALEKGKS